MRHLGSSRAQRGICTLLLLATHAAAQEPTAHKPTSIRPPLDSLEPINAAAVDSAHQRQRHARCWRARPMPECRMVFLTDIGIDMPLSTTSSHAPNPIYSKSFPARLNWSLGLMRNGDRHSHGVSLSITSDAGLRFPMIAEYRYRQWRNQFAIDAGLGLKRHEIWVDNGGLVAGTGLTTMLGFSPSRWFGTSLRYETMRVRGRRFTGVMLGVQSTRVSEYAFQFLAIGIRDWLLGLIGFEWEGEGEAETPPSD